MRIAFFSETYAPQVNGVVTTLGKLTEYLASRGHEVLLAVPRNSHNTQGDGIVGFRSVPLPVYPEMPIVLPHWGFHRKGLAQVEAFEPDLVHLLTPGVLAYFGQKWARQHGYPVVASYETDIIRYMRYYHFGVFEPRVWRYFLWLFNNCQQTYAPSRVTKSFLESRGIHKVEVLERGVDTERFHPSKRTEDGRKQLGAGPDDVIILYVGRLSKEKSLPLLLRSFARHSGDHPRTRLVITGEGPWQRTLRRRYRHPRVTFTGVKTGEDLASLFASADIFALPSTTETLSLVLMEAMASGVPVLAMNEGGVRDIVYHMCTGLLANTPEEFDAYLRRLIEDAALRCKLGQAGRFYAEGKSWTHAFENLERSYQKLLARNGDAAQ
jgi:phosphatidylinositol alpha 1,6-mannosyltransferase